MVLWIITFFVLKRVLVLKWLYEIGPSIFTEPEKVVSTVPQSESTTAPLWHPSIHYHCTNPSVMHEYCYPVWYTLHGGWLTNNRILPLVNRYFPWRSMIIVYSGLCGWHFISHWWHTSSLCNVCSKIDVNMQGIITVCCIEHRARTARCTESPHGRGSPKVWCWEAQMVRALIERIQTLHIPIFA